MITYLPYNYSELLQLAKGWGNFVSDRINIWRLLSTDQIADVALSLEYVKQYAASHSSLNYKQVYLLEQCVV